jgi:hypothetical protein
LDATRVNTAIFIVDSTVTGRMCLLNLRSDKPQFL